MAEFLITLGLEALSLLMIILTVSKRKKSTWLFLILSLVTAFLNGAFWYMAVTFETSFFGLQVWIYALIVASVIIYMAWKYKEKKIFKELFTGFVVCSAFVIIALIISVVSFSIPSNLKWSDETTNIVLEEEILVPENLQELKPQFCCVHNPKEKKYDLYWVWSNGVCKISSYTEDECTVYRLPDSRQDLPRLETKTEHFYKYNYNFEKYEEPTLLDQKTEETYTLYVCESSYKELYTK